LNTAALLIRPFAQGDALRVRELVIVVNRLLAPLSMAAQFESYIASALREEIDRIDEYYRERQGGFWIALESNMLRGTFGLERAGSDAMELRRMYVDPAARRRGIASRMLRHAEAQCLQRGCAKLVLSTAEFQVDAIRLYERAGFRKIGEETAALGSHKSVGAGVRRLHYEKRLHAT
jgi:GNAT superfamily N-acetyltransferase